MNMNPIREDTNNEIKWAVLGTGVIANEMAQALQKSGERLFAVGNRTNVYRCTSCTDWC